MVHHPKDDQRSRDAAPHVRVNSPQIHSGSSAILASQHASGCAGPHDEGPRTRSFSLHGSQSSRGSFHHPGPAPQIKRDADVRVGGRRRVAFFFEGGPVGGGNIGHGPRCRPPHRLPRGDPPDDDALHAARIGRLIPPAELIGPESKSSIGRPATYSPPCIGRIPPGVNRDRRRPRPARSGPGPGSRFEFGEDGRGRSNQCNPGRSRVPVGYATIRERPSSPAAAPAWDRATIPLRERPQQRPTCSPVDRRGPGNATNARNIRAVIPVRTRMGIAAIQPWGRGRSCSPRRERVARPHRASATARLATTRPVLGRVMAPDQAHLGKEMSF